jgi:hypothetical protein
MATLESPCETIYERVERLIGARDGCWPPLHTTPTHDVIAGLVARDQCLEQAIREIAVELQRLATDHERLKAHH